jgi:hypothetical protein
MLGNSVKIVEKDHGPWVQNRQDQLDEALLAAAIFNPLSLPSRRIEHAKTRTVENNAD